MGVYPQVRMGVRLNFNDIHNLLQQHSELFSEDEIKLIDTSEDEPYVDMYDLRDHISENDIFIGVNNDKSYEIQKDEENYDYDYFLVYDECTDCGQFELGDDFDVFAKMVKDFLPGKTIVVDLRYI